MTKPQAIAETHIRAVTPSGESRETIIKLTKPVQDPRGGFSCTVTLPDRVEPITIYGEDSLQALFLTMKFAGTRMHDMKDKGWAFYYPDTDEDLPLSVYFSPREARES